MNTYVLRFRNIKDLEFETSRSWKYCIHKCLSIKRLQIFYAFSNTNKFNRYSKLINNTHLKHEMNYKTTKTAPSKSRFVKLTTHPPLAEPSSFVKIKPVTPTTCRLEQRMQGKGNKLELRSDHESMLLVSG